MSGQDGKPNCSLEDLWSAESTNGMVASDALIQARTILLQRFKFFGRLAQHLRFVESKQIPTAAVNAKGTLYYNPWFINRMSIDDVRFTVMHEVMHLVQRCHSRFPPGGNHALWNKASDIVVNLALKEINQSPSAYWRDKFLALNDNFDHYQDWTTEEIYRDLQKQQEEGEEDCPACKALAEGGMPQEDEDGDNQGDGNSGDGDDVDGEGEADGDSEGSGGSNGSGGNSQSQDPGKFPQHTCGNPQGCCAGVTADPGDSPEAAEELDKWRRRMVSAAEGQSRGDLPGGVRNYIDELVKPTVRWQDIFRAKATRIFGKANYTWRKPSRRSHAMGVRLQHRLPIKSGGLVWLDTSGSISDSILKQFASECIGIMEQCGCTNLWIGLHHVYAYHLVQVNKGNIGELLFKKFESGGTSHMDCVAISNGERGFNGLQLPKGFDPGMVCYMTDMMSQFPEERPKHETLWGIPSQYYKEDNDWTVDPGYGRKVEIKIAA